MAVSGTAVGLMTGGGILVWSGLSGVTPLELTKTLASGGQAPQVTVGSLFGLIGKLIMEGVSAIGSGIASGATSLLGGLWDTIKGGVNDLFSSDPGGGPAVTPATLGGGDLGTRIAAQAQHYKGVPYVWGGASPSGWDCSGFVTWVLHHDLGLNLPDNQHTVSQSFLTWSGATTVPREQCQAGDLICWITHIAIATGRDTGIGAQNPRQGTIENSISNLGPGNGETYLIRRVIPQGGVSAPTKAQVI